MIALKSFVVDQTYMVKKDQMINMTIELLKQELKSKDNIIYMVLENYRQTTDYKPQTVKETAKQNNHSDKGERWFLTPRMAAKMRPLNNIPWFVPSNCFDALRMNIW